MQSFSAKGQVVQFKVVDLPNKWETLGGEKFLEIATLCFSVPPLMAKCNHRKLPIPFSLTNNMDKLLVFVQT